jgi:hypothetical protein
MKPVPSKAEESSKNTKLSFFLPFLRGKGGRRIKLSKQELNAQQKSGVISHDEKSVTISESRLLVPLAKSKKLAALRQQSQALQTIEKKPVKRDDIASPGLNKEVNGLIKVAQEDINAKIDSIMASYPPGKKNKLFSLRYGSPESIKQMAMKTIFTRLGLVKAKKFALIESLDYFGNDKIKQ